MNTVRFDKSSTSRKELQSYYNTLACLLKSLEMKSTTVDLRNEACVCGRITKVDGFMNVEMSNVVYYNPKGKRYPFEDFFINARNIRYVHIPEGLSAKELITQQLESLSNRSKPKQKKSFKQIRSSRYQNELVTSLN